MQGKRRADWLDQVLAFLPPRLHRWFARKWAEPAAWHSARLAFARTAAVWSMVGHICGLGDRHGARERGCSRLHDTLRPSEAVTPALTRCPWRDGPDAMMPPATTGYCAILQHRAF